MSTAAQKKNTKPKAQPAAAEAAPAGDDLLSAFEKEIQKKVRNATKKLGQIADLAQKAKDKEIVLNDEQKEKVGSKKAIEAQIADLENQAKTYKAQQAAEAKKVREAEKKKEHDMKKAREDTLSQVANLLVIHNLGARGVDLQGHSDSVGVLSGALNALLSDGDSRKVNQRASFVSTWMKYVSSNQDLQGLLQEGSSIPASIPSKVEEAKPAAEEPAKPKKAPKPLPAEYIYKAVDDRVVAEEDKAEEVAGEGADIDFLGGFDAFDDSDEGDAQPAPAKEEPKPAAEPAQAEGDNRGGRGRGERGAGRGRGRWEDGENRGGRGRGDRGNRGDRGRGGRGRGGNQNQDNEGFQMVTEDDKKRGRGGRGRGDRGRGRGDRGDFRGRGRGGEDRPYTAGEGRGGRGGDRGDRGARGGRPQTSKMTPDQLNGKTAGEEKKE